MDILKEFKQTKNQMNLQWELNRANLPCRYMEKKQSIFLPKQWKGKVFHQTKWIKSSTGNTEEESTQGSLQKARMFPPKN